MKYRDLVATQILAVAAVISLSAQQAPTFKAGSYVPPRSSYVPPKTPWGDPQISGIYDFQTVVRMERPREFAGKRVLTEQEFREYIKRYELNQDACGVGTRVGEVCTPEEDAAVGAYNEFWDDRQFVKDTRTSLIEDPEDGRIPPMTPEGQKRFAEWEAARKARGPLDSWLDFSAVTRCIAEQTPNGSQRYNGGTLIMQSPGWVMLVRERLDTRFIPLDGRPHIDPNIRLWHGHSVGRWEGNTLVVDTTNFTDKQTLGGAGATIPVGIAFRNFHLVERFVPQGPNLIHYYATIEDSTTWTRPWTFMLPWQKDASYVIYEYACQEGNISIENSLRGERMLEQQRAEAAKLAASGEHTAALIGKTEAEIRGLFGAPKDTVNTRWIYELVNGDPLYLYFGEGRVKIVAPNDVPLDRVVRKQ
jgi:hypothetical protein